MFSISSIPAFKDNYIWLLSTPDGRAAVVDPGDAAPVIAALTARGLQLECILITHHHADHQGGVQALLERWPAAQVLAPAHEPVAACTQPLQGGEQIDVLGTPVTVLAVPGHTLGHLAYGAGEAVFCGDTLFGAGCGRLFEGTPAQMLASLEKLAALPDATRLYCAHEYTAMNLHFAAAVEPENPEVLARAARVAEMRAQGQSTVPLLLAEEKATNPFLRYREAAVIRQARAQAAAVDASPLAVFTALRAWRNHFQAAV